MLSVFTACATFALGSVLISKMFEFKEVPQSDFWETVGTSLVVQDLVIKQKKTPSRAAEEQKTPL